MRSRHLNSVSGPWRLRALAFTLSPILPVAHSPIQFHPLPPCAKFQNKPTHPHSRVKIEDSAAPRAKTNPSKPPPSGATQPSRPSSRLRAFAVRRVRPPKQKYAERVVHKLHDTLRVPRNPLHLLTSR